MLRLLSSTGWRRLAIVLLVIWEAYWLYQWWTNGALASDLAARDYYQPVYPASDPEFDAAYAAEKQALAILVISPFVTLAAFLAAIWVRRGFGSSSGKSL